MPALKFFSPDTAFPLEMQDCSKAHTHFMDREQLSMECVPRFILTLMVWPKNPSLPCSWEPKGPTGLVCPKLVTLVTLVVSCALPGGDIRG